ncbi:putative tpr domain protein [Diplodia seriata]|uniref:Putative tpr domain protein n=1 Tax=Diplodia seriata TaxID=420778 RepID=A0A0G2GL21_9PEZI|nr:putative tpr domain protein [Diplodia seriata]
MGKTKPHGSSKKSKKSSAANKKPKMTAPQLLAQATALLQTSQADEALVAARRAYALLHPDPEHTAPTAAALPALTLLGEINVELGDIDTARDYFLVAAALDEDGAIPEAAGGGAEKFMWLAQLCEEGGAESVAWFDKGAEVLRREIAELEARKQAGPERDVALDEKKRKLANALCGVVEVFMTDLSWEEDAEQKCEALITEALLVHPNNPESLQTLASVRISQLRHDEARNALKMSMDLWKELKPEDPKVPDFPVRISLSRLLMEAELEDEALEVLERLILEDDQSVEAWYLGGWCLHLMAEKKKQSEDEDTVKGLLKSSRQWLTNSQRLYQLLEYEDERLKDHADELVEGINKILGPPVEGEDEDEAEEWEDAGESDSDEEMQGA